MDFWKQLGDALLPILIPVLSVAIPALATALTALAVQYFRLLTAKIQSENPTGYAKAMDYAKDAVVIAEQLGIAGLLDVSGKKQYAIDYVQKLCDTNKIKIDIATLEALVEKAVYTELTTEKLWTTPVVPKPVGPNVG